MEGMGMNGFLSVNSHDNDHAVNSHDNSAPPIAPDASAAAGTKRKRDSRSAQKFYAVRVGEDPGIYYSWQECLGQVRGFPKAQFKSFTTLTDATAYLNNEDGTGGGGANGGADSGKFYGVRSGRKPGVYTSWPQVQEQITGWKGPKHKVFKTREEAELFALEGDVEGMNAGDTPNKKAKKGKKGGDNNGSPGLANGGEWEAGDGPLPEGAEDNFDYTITLDGELGTARYKTASELAQTKTQASAPILTAPLRIYTDGSSLANGTQSSMAGVGVYFGPRDTRNISEPLTGTKQTNQRAELTAILRALEVAPKNRRVTILSDSNYAIKCTTEWFVKWRSNNWQNASHKPVENKDLISKIVDLLDERVRLNQHRADEYGEVDEGVEGDEPPQYWARGPAGVRFQWVKGHAKDEGNNAADELAVSAARAAREMGDDIELD